MFATAIGSQVSQRQAGAYKQMHVTTAVDGASPHRLIAMLFDGLVDAMAEARGAMRSGNIGLKGRAVARALRIVDEGLSGALNLDDGGAIAQNLYALYGYVSLRLTQANLHNDESAVVECGELIEKVRGAWFDIADQVAA